MDPTRKIATQAHKRLRRCRALAKRCARKPARGCIHELRTQSRRLLADLELIARFVPPAELEAGRRAIRKQLKATAALRDVHVQLRLVKPLIRSRSPLKPFRRYLRDARERCARAAVEKLSRAKLRRKIERLDRVVRAATRSKLHPDFDAFRVILGNSHRRCIELRREAAGSSGLHRLRLALKNYCYLAEALRPHLPEITGGRIEQLNRLRSRMGDANDLTQLEKAVRKFSEKTGASAKPTLSTLARRRARLERSCRLSSSRLLR